MALLGSGDSTAGAAPPFTLEAVFEALHVDLTIWQIVEAHGGRIWAESARLLLLS